MEAWRAEAVDEIKGLKPYWVSKHGWQPDDVETEEAIDLYVRLRRRRLDGRTLLIRSRYLADWREAGRRETFVNPLDRSQEGIEFWPPHNTVRGVNPQHNPPAVCLKGSGLPLGPSFERAARRRHAPWLPD
jgi:hypothetical protein